jgi:hypothetical protein
MIRKEERKDRNKMLMKVRKEEGKTKKERPKERRRCSIFEEPDDGGRKHL